MILVGGYANIGARSLKHVLKEGGTSAMRPFSDMFRRHLTIYGGKLTRMNSMNSWPPEKESAPDPDGIPYSLYRCAEGLGSTLLFKV